MKVIRILCIFLLMVIEGTYAHANLSSGLITHYTFDNDTTGQVLDEPGNGYSGTVSGNVTYTNGINGLGQATSFNGTNGYIQTRPNPLSNVGVGDFTISTWVNINQIKTNYLFFFGDNLSGPEQSIRSFIDGNSKVMFYVYDDTLTAPKDSFITSNRALVSGNWYHLTFSRKNAMMSLYINGDPEGSVASHQSFDSTAFANSATIGIRPANWSYPFSGQIDEFRVYNRALSPNEIKILYNQKTDISSEIQAFVIPNQRNQKVKTNGPNECNGDITVSSSPGPISASSGNFYHTHNDLNIPARGIPLSVTRYYNSQDLYDGPFGHGWNMDYTARLEVAQKTDGTVQATVHMGNGVRREFMQQPDESFLAPTGQDDTLFKKTDGSYIFNGECGTNCTPKPRNAYLFNAGGQLTALDDVNNNRITIAYNAQNRIEQVTDANNRSLMITYGANGRIATVADFSDTPRVWTYAYDVADNLISVLDPDNNRIQYQYDAEHNLTGIVDALGNTVANITYDATDKAINFSDNGGSYALGFDPVSKVTSKTNPADGLFTFQYDDNGNVSKKAAPDGGITTLNWDANVDLSSKTNANDVSTAYSYDSQHNITSVIADSGDGKLNRTSQYAYDSLTGKVNQIIDPLNNTTSMTYDAKGNLLTLARPTGTASFKYDSFGQITQSTDPDGVTTAYSYDSNGNLLSQSIVDTLPLIKTTFTYDTRGNRLTAIDPNGNVTDYSYTKLDQLATVTDALDNISQFSYDGNGNMVQTLDPSGTRTDYVYDTYDRLITRIDAVSTPLERQTSYTYDSRGNLLTLTDPLNHTTSYTYDAQSRVTKVTDALNNSWNFSFDPIGNLLSKTDPNGNITQYGYDSLNRLASVTDAENHVTTYAYDANGRLETITDANNHVATTLSYDNIGRLISNKDALLHESSSTYTNTGRTATQTDAKGNITTYTYSAITGRLAEIVYATNHKELFNYDLAGNLLSIADTETGYSVSYSYDALNRPISETQLGQILSFAYDSRGNRTEISTMLNGVDSDKFLYSFDKLNRLSELSKSHKPSGSTVWTESDLITVSYNAADQRTGISYSNGATSTYSYDAVNRLTSLIHKKADASVISSYGYSYDAMGNRLTETDHSLNNITYNYDKTYKLLSANDPVTGTSSFTYDAVGNRLSNISAGSITATQYQYDIANRLIQVTQPDASVITYAYDNNGNQQTRTHGTEITSYQFDRKNQLTQVSLPNSSSADYQYDPLGRRVRRNDSNGIKRFIYDGHNPLADITGDSVTPVLEALYMPMNGLDLLASRFNAGDSSSEYYLRDGLNSVRQIMDNTGMVTASYDYHPYGEIKNSTGSSNNRFTYTGRSSEADGLMYYRSRYYDPYTGRFLKKDRYQGDIQNPMSLHRYAYVHGNPVNYLDPKGKAYIRKAVQGCIGYCLSLGIKHEGNSLIEGLWSGIALDYGFGKGTADAQASITINEGEIKKGVTYDISASVTAPVGVVAGQSIDKNGDTKNFGGIAVGVALASMSGIDTHTTEKFSLKDYFSKDSLPNDQNYAAAYMQGYQGTVVPQIANNGLDVFNPSISSFCPPSK